MIARITVGLFLLFYAVTLITTVPSSNIILAVLAAVAGVATLAGV